MAAQTSHYIGKYPARLTLDVTADDYACGEPLQAHDCAFARALSRHLHRYVQVWPDDARTYAEVFASVFNGNFDETARYKLCEAGAAAVATYDRRGFSTPGTYLLVRVPHDR